MDTFPDIGTPDYGLGVDTEAEVDETVMGDGYILRRPKGINYLKDVWNPTWSNLDAPVARSTRLWLKARLKTTPFLWKEPTTGQMVQVVCDSVSLSYNSYNYEVLNATFKQDFNPA